LNSKTPDKGYFLRNPDLNDLPRFIQFVVENAL